MENSKKKKGSVFAYDMSTDNTIYPKQPSLRIIFECGTWRGRIAHSDLKLSYGKETSLVMEFHEDGTLYKVFTHPRAREHKVSSRIIE